MNKQQEALRLALEALEVLGWQPTEEAMDYRDNAIDAIREALAEQPAQQAPKWQGVRFDSALHEQPAQEPPTVAELLCVCGAEWEWRNRDWELVATPPASKPWVPLTEFDIDQIPYSCSHADSRLIAFAIEAKLREKNERGVDMTDN